jgi:hypothetical protein
MGTNKKISLVSFVLIMLGQISCGSNPAEVTPLPFEDLTEAEYFTVPHPATVAIKDDAAWNQLWEDYWTRQDSLGKTPPPAVDFEQDMVIAVFWGCSYSYYGCYSWADAIERIITRSGRIEVHVGPLPDLGGCDMNVCPLQVVKMRKSDLPVVFIGDVTG